MALAVEHLLSNIENSNHVPSIYCRFLRLTSESLEKCHGEGVTCAVTWIVPEVKSIESKHSMLPSRQAVPAQVYHQMNGTKPTEF